jgi:hypothetical protein
VNQKVGLARQRKTYAPLKKAHLNVLKTYQYVVLTLIKFDKMNKKAAEAMWFIIVGAILALLIFVFGASMIAKTRDASNDVISPKLLEFKDSQCLSDTEKSRARGNNPPDLDGDDRADACDICVGKNNEGNNDEDGDLDKMPTYCDEDDSDRTITKCKSEFTVTKDKRCVEASS